MEQKRKPRKKKVKKVNELEGLDRAEVSKFSREQLIELFTNATYELAEQGLITPERTREILRDLPKLLSELLDN